MKQPNVIWVEDALSEITRNKSSITSKAKAEAEVAAAVKTAEALACNGLERLNRVWNEKRRKRVRCWKNDPVLCKWFGDDHVTVRQIRVTRRRMQRAHDRLSKRQLTIRLKKQSGTTYNGHNLGGPLTPKTFVLYPKWFAKAANIQGAIIVHELMHDWSKDHKDNNGNKYGAAAAANIARQKPVVSRRNPENFEHYVLNA